MKKLPVNIFAAVFLATVEMATAQQPPAISQTLLVQPKSNPQTDSEQALAKRTAQQEWLLAHPDKTIKDLNEDDPEFQITLAKDQGLSSDALKTASDDAWNDLQALRKSQNDDAQIGQQGSPKPVDQLLDLPPSQEQPIQTITGKQPWNVPTFDPNNPFPGNSIGGNIPVTVTWKQGGNSGKGGSSFGNGGGGNVSAPGGSGSGSSGNGSYGNNNSGGGGQNASWYISQACPIFHQTALSYYQAYQVEQQTTVNLLAQIIATADPNTAALNRIILSGLQSGKSAQQIGDDLCNYYAQHLSQFVGNVGAGSGAYKSATSQPQTVTQPTPVAMPGYGNSSTGNGG